MTDSPFNKPQMNMTAEQMLGYIVAQVDSMPSQIKTLVEYKDSSREVIQNCENLIDILTRDRNFDRDSIGKLKKKVESLRLSVDGVIFDIKNFKELVEKVNKAVNNISELKDKEIPGLSAKIDGLIAEKEMESRVREGKLAIVNRFFSRYGALFNAVISGIVLWFLIESLKGIK